MINAWHWFGLTAILVTLEVMVGASFFLLWLGISALTIGLFVLFYPALAWEYQFLMFAGVAIACLWFWYVQLKHKVHVSDKPNLNRRNEQYVGRTVTLTAPIVNGRGKIHIDDSFWRIEGPELPEGTLVKVIGVDGVVLKITKAD